MMFSFNFFNKGWTCAFHGDSAPRLLHNAARQAREQEATTHFASASLRNTSYPVVISSRYSLPSSTPRDEVIEGRRVGYIAKGPGETYLRQSNFVERFSVEYDGLFVVIPNDDKK